MKQLSFALNESFLSKAASLQVFLERLFKNCEAVPRDVGPG